MVGNEQPMTRRNKQLLVVAAIIVVAIPVILLIANLSPFDHQCAWQFPKIVSCLLSARETLSAGLIGTGGAVFAGWLAYSAAMEASDRALTEARDAKRQTLEQEVATLSTNIDRLRHAKAYLEKFTENFGPTGPGASSAGFTQALRECHSKALDFVSSSAIGAPFGYGAQISTIMTRVDTLGERIDQAMSGSQAIHINNWNDDVFKLIEGIRAVAAQIGSDIPAHEKHLRRLTERT